MPDPEAETLRKVRKPIATVWLCGWVVMIGGGMIVRVAAVEVALLTLFVATHSYSLPLSPAAALLIVRVAVADPVMPLPSDKGVQALPPFVDTCQA